MKALLVIAASLFFSSHIEAETMNKAALTDSFTDVVKSVKEEERVLVVTFKLHAALYKVGKDNPQFAEIKAKLEKAQKVAQKLKVVAIIPSMTIQEINEIKE